MYFIFNCRQKLSRNWIEVLTEPVRAIMVLTGPKKTMVSPWYDHGEVRPIALAALAMHRAAHVETTL